MREGEHLLIPISVTEDTSQRPMSWSNETASKNTAQVPHTPQATQNTPHQQEEGGPVRVQKGLRTDLQGEVSTASEDRDTARERAGAVGRRRGGIDARGKRACGRREALTKFHGGHSRHVPAANVLVERSRIKEHCAGPTRGTKQQKTHHTNKKNEARSEFKKGLRTDSQGKVSKASEDQRRGR
jgi:hypothetical protein